MEKYDINKVYTQYKEFIASYIDLKALASKIIEQRQLSPVMNDTKWLELQTAILSIPEFEPAYNIQLLTDNITYSPIFEQVPTYLGSWEFIYENYEYQDSTDHYELPAVCCMGSLSDLHGNLFN